MRTLDHMEVERVAGAEWEAEADFGIVRFKVSGEETVQEIAAATATVASTAYWGARDAMADFYERVATGWNYSMACSYHYY